MIRYQSLSMPVMVLSETSIEETDEKINIECDDDKNVDSSNKIDSESSPKEGR